MEYFVHVLPNLSEGRGDLYTSGRYIQVDGPADIQIFTFTLQPQSIRLFKFYIVQISQNSIIFLYIGSSIFIESLTQIYQYIIIMSFPPLCLQQITAIEL